MARTADALRAEISRLVAEYHREAFPDEPFIAGESYIGTGGRVFDAQELRSLVDASLDFWLTEGPYATQFSKALSQRVGARHTTLTNSGSSANLLAVSALTSQQLGADRLRPGDEVITVAAGFPTTINPILQNQLVPVFVDVTIPEYNIDVAQIEAAISPRTRALMLGHTLGNPCDLEAVMEIVRRHDLWFIEDCCDALGSTYDGTHVGTFGDLATLSFYPAHQITTGEGGAVFTNSARLRKLVESFRDWGRDCWCPTGDQNTCGKRFGWEMGSLPPAYDHKYIYSHIGYNLKLTDLQAAVGVAQLPKLESFVATRRANFDRLWSGLEDLQDALILPRASPRARPAWFGFPISVHPDAPFDRSELVGFLEERRIGTRHLFAGNLLRQPGYAEIPHRIQGILTQSDFVADRTFWLGVYSRIGPAEIDYVVGSLQDFVLRGHRRKRRVAVTNE